MNCNINQTGLWERMNLALKHVRKDTKRVFIPRIVIRKAEYSKAV